MDSRGGSDLMGGPTRGFHHAARPTRADLPPGQHVVPDRLPVRSANLPRPAADHWSLTLTTEHGRVHHFDRDRLAEHRLEPVVADLHCVTGWSAPATRWLGVSVDHLFAAVDTSARHALVSGRDGYTSRIAMADLLEVQAWIVLRSGPDDLELDLEQGGPARLLVPHLYLFKSVKWVSDLTLTNDEDEPGFWESLGRHPQADPWREQRYWST